VLLPRAIRFTRRNLPHLEVDGGRYFVTVRCADSLPNDVVGRLEEFHRDQCATDRPSDQRAPIQRRYFRTMEKYLDSGLGKCVLRDPIAAEALASEFRLLAEWRISVPHFSIMPNHWHAVVAPAEGCTHVLSEVMKRLKGRSAKTIRRRCGGNGPVWQREWFDRWIRNEAEMARIIAYIRNNPVTAGLVRTWQDHPWTC
jgi:REP-associated tyrosine transposase